MMKNKLSLKPGCADDAYLSRMFRWLARIGACPRFGSRPIGWYQAHAMAALNHLEKQGGFPVALRNGMICYRPSIGPWQPIITPRQLFADIDTSIRTNP